MSKWKIFISMTGLMILSACSISASRSYQEKIDLPPGTGVKTTEELIRLIWNDNFPQKIMDKFPYFDPIKYPQKYGLSLKYISPHVAYPIKNEKADDSISLLLSIKYTDEIKSPEEIIAYGKTIIEQRTKDYFQKRP